MIEASGWLGWLIVCLYTGTGVLAWTRAVVRHSPVLDACAAMCAAMAWSLLAGRGVHGMVTEGVAMVALWYAALPVLLLAAASMLHSISAMQRRS